MRNAEPLACESGLWLTRNATARARYHHDPGCRGLEWAATAAQDQGVPVTELLQRVEFDIDLLLEAPRMFCRACGLEPATVDILTHTAADTRTVTCTVAAAPEPALSGRTRTTVSESAVARLARIASAAGLGYTHEPRTGAVMYGVVGVRALRFLERNYWMVMPPPGTPMTDEVVATAWTLVADQPLADTDRWWETALSVLA